MSLAHMTPKILLETVACAVCGGTDNRPLYQSSPMQSGLFAGVRNSICECTACGFIFSNPRPEQQAYIRHYGELDEGSGQVFRSLQSGGDLTEGSTLLAQYISEILKQRPNGRLVDIGCGVGSFINALNTEHWTVEGIEPSANAASTARTDGLTIHEGFFGSIALEPGGYDVVTILNVLEHIWDPNMAMQEINRIAKDDALLVVAVPNTRYPILGLAEFFEIEHVSHFTAQTLSAFLRKNGWRDVHWETRFGKEKGLFILAARGPGIWTDLANAEIVDERELVRQAVEDYAANREQLVGTIRNKLAERLDRWLQDGTRVALYGAGSYAAQLVDALGGELTFDMVFDGDPRKWGQSFLGKTIHNPEDIQGCGVDVFLVASGTFVSEISTTIHRFASPDVEIVTLSAG